jgi:transcriptional regulator with XRE-family HTH domain
MTRRPRVGLIDVHLGRKIREIRASRGLTEEGLGKLLGISFQQLQKYETGHNRITAGRLWLLCRRLDVPMASMFEDVDESMFKSGRPTRRGTKAKRS